MKILAIPGSNSGNGINRQLLQHVGRLLDGGGDSGVEFELVDLNDYEMPIYSQERQADGIPALAQQLFDKIGAADAMVVSFAEHNGTFSAAWKNVYDWMSRIDMGVYQDKKVVMLAASPGGRGGAGVLEAATMTAPFFKADLVGSLGIGMFYENFDLEAGVLTDAALSAELSALLDKLS